MTERDPILGYCVDCPTAKEIFDVADRDGPKQESTADIQTAVLVALGERAIKSNCEGPVPDIEYGQPIMICGQQRRQLTVEDIRRIQQAEDIENPWQQTNDKGE